MPRPRHPADRPARNDSAWRIAYEQAMRIVGDRLGICGFLSEADWAAIRSTDTPELLGRRQPLHKETGAVAAPASDLNPEPSMTPH